MFLRSYECDTVGKQNMGQLIGTVDSVWRRCEVNGLNCFVTNYNSLVKPLELELARLEVSGMTQYIARASYTDSGVKPHCQRNSNLIVFTLVS